MENIANFLEACTNYGISKENLFQTVDLYEAANIPRVLAISIILIIIIMIIIMVY